MFVLLFVVVAFSLAGVSLFHTFFLVEPFRALCLMLGYTLWGSLGLLLSAK